MFNSKKMFAITLICLVGLFLVGTYFYKNIQSKKMEQIAAGNQSSLIRDYSPSIGSPMLRVNVVEFLDPECEACRFFHPIVKELLKKYEGQIYYVVRYAPFHPNSKFAIKILDAARKQGKYWETLDLLFEKLPEWGDHHSPKPELIWTYLPQLDLDISKIKTDMDDPDLDKMIEQEIIDGRTFGIRATPTFFINNKPLVNLGPEQLEAAISLALE